MGTQVAFLNPMRTTRCLGLWEVVYPSVITIMVVAKSPSLTPLGAVPLA